MGWGGVSSITMVLSWRGSSVEDASPPWDSFFYLYLLWIKLSTHFDLNLHSQNLQSSIQRWFILCNVYIPRIWHLIPSMDIFDSSHFKLLEIHCICLQLNKHVFACSKKISQRWECVAARVCHVHSTTTFQILHFINLAVRCDEHG